MTGVAGMPAQAVEEMKSVSRSNDFFMPGFLWFKIGMIRLLHGASGAAREMRCLREEDGNPVAVDSGRKKPLTFSLTNTDGHVPECCHATRVLMRHSTRITVSLTERIMGN
jgi:hypothetical protein